MSEANQLLTFSFKDQVIQIDDPAFLQTALEAHSQLLLGQDPQKNNFWSKSAVKVELLPESVLLGKHSHVFKLRLSSDQNSFTILIKKVVPADLKKEHANASLESWKRNVKSYQVEMYFYAELSQLLKDFLPQVLYTSAYIPPDPMESAFLAIVEDLSDWDQLLEMNTLQTHLCLDNLVYLHSTFWENSEFSRNSKLWPLGAWWTLEKRPENEIEQTSSSFKKWCEHHSERVAQEPKSFLEIGLRLQKKAKWVSDQLVPGNDLRNRTLVHGDCKTANIFFEPSGKAVKFIDFQWAGFGHPQLDLVYLLTSSLSTKDFIQHEQSYIQYYFDQLKKSQPKFIASFEEFLFVYNLVFLDYMRCVISYFYPTLTKEVYKKNEKVLGRVGHNRSVEHAIVLAKKVDCILEKIN